MLQLTKRSEYGLIALVHLVDRAGEFVSAREISERFSIPRRLLAEVLKDLCRESIVESQRGSTGGYALARPARAISLGAVVTALEGAVALTSCGATDEYRPGDCEVESLCPIKSPLQRVRAGIWGLLEKTTLQDLAADRRDLRANASPSPTSSITA